MSAAVLVMVVAVVSVLSAPRTTSPSVPAKAAAGRATPSAASTAASAPVPPASSCRRVRRSAARALGWSVEVARPVMASLPGPRCAGAADGTAGAPAGVYDERRMRGPHPVAQRGHCVQVITCAGIRPGTQRSLLYDCELMNARATAAERLDTRSLP